MGFEIAHILGLESKFIIVALKYKRCKIAPYAIGVHRTRAKIKKTERSQVLKLQRVKIQDITDKNHTRLTSFLDA